ncbi:MAG: hydroxymethylglutaryl-CoA lyase [Flavobacteriales bacterium]|nr:hydroxymethylglutaryl-CoA lyase [Flavobacteriales bacterium]|tara:strand:- start:414 stop:1256 length:843 start_codon:yes stop_codon:yes gene_type:complete
MKITECPRDAIQGIKKFIPTEVKIKYINSLLQVGFDTIDFGSFVSESTIPQLKDTDIVIKNLDLSETKTKLLSIVANNRGANFACSFDAIDFLGFPLSVSENFQLRNTNKSISDAIKLVEDLQSLVFNNNKELLIYISMSFGNPYGETYHPDIVAELVNKLNELDINYVSLADTIGVSNSTNIKPLFKTLIHEFPNIEFGAHFHSRYSESKEKIISAYESGCRKFDSTIKGFGGCPMADDNLVGNIPTEVIISIFNNLEINNDKFKSSALEFDNIISSIS